MLIGCALAWGGLLWSPLRPLYDYGWFVGFGAAFLIYLALMRLSEATPRKQ
jgi:cytosine/uracil/thiamine/allantoin permease